jgi:hypothetical protein
MMNVHQTSAAIFTIVFNYFKVIRSEGTGKERQRNDATTSHSRTKEEFQIRQIKILKLAFKSA